MIKVADTHAHLTDLKDLDNAIKSAEQVGVFAIISVGMDLRSNKKTLQIVEEYKESSIDILPALGLHPWDLLKKDIKPTIAHMEDNINNAVGIGEVGLDYWIKDVKKNPVKKSVQLLAFKKAILLAKKYDKPITVHSRGAWEDCYNALLELKAKRVVFHWYSGSMDLLKKIIDRGFYVSATPAVAYSKDHRTAILHTPIERLLLETDSPVRYGSLVSQPKDVLITLKEVSKLKSIKLNEIAEKTSENFLTLLAKQY